MIPVPRAPEPEGFDEQVRQRGQQWLASNTTKEPPSYWADFRHHLWLAFGKRCGYSAMIDPTGGQVDHYLAVSTHRHLSYEWANYRLASGSMNQYKKANQVLDPYDVGEGRFEILLPSLQLVATDQIPAPLRDLADFTLRQLHLRDGEQVIRQRQQWFEMYQQGQFSLTGLRAMAPLIAASVEKHGVLPSTAPPRRSRRSKITPTGALRLPGIDEATADQTEIADADTGNSEKSP